MEYIIKGNIINNVLIFKLWSKLMTLSLVTSLAN